MLPSGWLVDEGTDFAETIKNAVVLLGDSFTAALVQLCASPDFIRDKYLLHFFLEINLPNDDGFLWTESKNIS